jgi:hypothetical protein
VLELATLQYHTCFQINVTILKLIFSNISYIHFFHTNISDYTVGSACGWSDIFWFNTYPAPSEKWSPSFAVYGDMGNKNAVSLPALQRDTQSGMYDMILHVGDFAYDMNNVSK